MNDWKKVSDIGSLEGFYWFYGYLSKQDEVEGYIPEMFMLRIHEHSVECCEDYKFDFYTMRGLWLKVYMPEYPKEFTWIGGN